MRWLTFLMIAGLALTCQSALAPYVQIVDIRPDWLLVVVVFFALYARVADAIAGAWVIGMAADLMTIERLGLLALSYTFAAILVILVRDYLFSYRASTQFVVTFVVCVAVRVGWLSYQHLMYGAATSLWSNLLGPVLLGSLYTAAWAPLVHRLLLAKARWLGIPQPRYTHVGMVRGR